MCNDPGNVGYLFEKVIYDTLKSTNMFDEIHYETELTKRWGFNASSIDYLLVVKDKAIVVQVKWRKTRRRENLSINNFIKSIQHVQKYLTDKQIIMGLWISRRKPFDDNVKELYAHNIKCICDYDSMTKLATEMIDQIKKTIMK